MVTLCLSYGAPALFLVSFLAATLLPLGSEWLLSGLLIADGNPGLLISVATIGNVLGACTTYWIGLSGSAFLTEKILRMNPQTISRSEKFYQIYGSWSLLLSWVPVIGDPLCLAGGVMRVGFIRFLIPVIIGKSCRYLMVSVITLKFI